VTGKAFRPRVVELGKARHLLAGFVWTYLALAVFLPVLALVWAALINFLTVNLSLMNFDLRHFRYILFEYPKTYTAVWNSFVLGVLSATAVCLLGLMIGWVLVRSRSRLRMPLDILGMAPIAIPSLTFALGLLWLYVGLRWLPIYGTVGILLLAYVAHFLPYGVRASSSALRQLHPELEEAARVGGATWNKALRYVTFPLARPTLAAAWILVFIMAMQEVSASMLLYNNRSVVISVTVFLLWEQGNIGGLAALSVLHLAFMFVLVSVLVRTRHREFAT
jgi:iron(III) transport system permease protein